jgi:hypothetical protein
LKKLIPLALLLQTVLAYAQYEPLENRWEYLGGKTAIARPRRLLLVKTLRRGYS